MVRYSRPSRMSVGRNRRQKVPLTRGLIMNRRAAASNSGDNSVGSGSESEGARGENPDRPTGSFYEIYDICDRNRDSNYYRVRWKNFKDRKYDTYEPGSYLKDLGFEKTLKEIDEYITWKEKYLEKNPRKQQAPNIYKYRKMKGSPVYTDNEHFTCATTALNIMCSLLNINFSFNQEIINRFNGTQGFRYSKLCQMIQYQQKLLKTDFLSIEGMKNNYTKGCHNDTNEIMKKISVEPGVYLGGARNGTGAHHMFVLKVCNYKVYIFDESLEMMDKLISKNTLS